MKLHGLPGGPGRKTSLSGHWAPTGPQHTSLTSTTQQRGRVWPDIGGPPQAEGNATAAPQGDSGVESLRCMSVGHSLLPLELRPEEKGTLILQV